ncbi:MAG TPA: transglycosylase SLT domain-containing protein [Thermoanaerobaculia bacterium]|nr:transglycosylase SLT domain-containing protein [Thermoanaerobaculia bacterium]
MISTVALFLSLAASDPRPLLIQMQLDGRLREALARVEQELEDSPAASRRLGLDFLRGHLLDRLGDSHDAADAFAESMNATPALSLHSRYRLALEQDRMGHPEVAAGLVATVVRAGEGPLQTDAIRLLDKTLATGGDCRLLRGLRPEGLETAERRQLLLTQAECALKGDLRELGRNLLINLLRENQADEPARIAAEHLSGMVSEQERGQLPLLLGMTFHQHREFERALLQLRRAQGKGDGLPGRDLFEARYAAARSQFWMGQYVVAAGAFGALVSSAPSPQAQAKVLYQQGRSYELFGQWKQAAVTFRRAYQAEPQGDWAAAALISALRVEWRGGDESTAAPILELLSSRRDWRETLRRAALFLASSDLVRGRRNRAGTWLEMAAGGDADDRLEVSYWRGRLEELERDGKGAVASYLTVLRLDPYHPLARAALLRLDADPLRRTALSEGKRLLASKRPEDLFGAWVLLGEDPAAATAQRKLKERLLADRTTARFVQLAAVPVDRWPLWKRLLGEPDEMLLALGAWHEGAPAVPECFPVTGDPSLAFTGSALLSRAGETGASIALAEALRNRAPARVPLAVQPQEFQRLLYPLPYRETLVAQSRLRGVDLKLLAALFRAESRFEPEAMSPTTARGLAQLTLPTARRIADQIELGRLDVKDLYRPEVSIALGAAHLGELMRAYKGNAFLAVAAFNAGESQTNVWRNYCYSQEPEEMFTKVGFRETRSYLRRVLTSWGHYQELYR